MSTDLIDRLKPFPRRLIHENPSGGGQYVRHSVVVQRLLDLFGSFDFEVVTVLYGDVDALEPNPNGKSERAKRGAPELVHVAVGAVCRLRVEIDGKSVSIEDVGDCESPHNWPHDGARLKDATSDAIKRCAARLGVGIHLWAGGEAYLYEQLRAAQTEGQQQLEGVQA